MDEPFADVACRHQACLVGFVGLIALSDMMSKSMVCWLWSGMEPTCRARGGSACDVIKSNLTVSPLHEGKVSKGGHCESWSAGVGWQMRNEG